MIRHPFSVELVALVDEYLRNHPGPDGAKHAISAVANVPISDLIDADITATTWPGVPARVRGVIGVARIVAEAVYGPEESRLAEELTWP